MFTMLTLPMSSQVYNFISYTSYDNYVVILIKFISYTCMYIKDEVVNLLMDTSRVKAVDVITLYRLD